MDQDGEVVDVFFQAKRVGAAAKRFDCHLYVGNAIDFDTHGLNSYFHRAILDHRLYVARPYGTIWSYF